MAATKALGFVLPTGLFIQPSLNRRGGVRVSVVQCSVSSLTSTGTDFPISLFALFDLFPELWIEIGFRFKFYVYMICFSDYL